MHCAVSTRGLPILDARLCRLWYISIRNKVLGAVAVAAYDLHGLLYSQASLFIRNFQAASELEDLNIHVSEPRIL